MNDEPIQPQDAPRRSQVNVPAILVLVGLGALSLTLSCFLGTARSGAFLFGLVALVGLLIVIQCILLSLWAVFGPQPLVIRLSATMLLTPLVMGIFALPAFMTGASFDISVGQLLTTPLTSLLAQTPLWGCRLLTGWRLIWLDKERREPRESQRLPVEGIENEPLIEVPRLNPRQFRLQDLIVWMVAIAVALGLAKSADGGLPSVHGMGMAQAGLSGIGMAVYSAWFGLPCFWAVFAASSRRRAWIVLFIFAAISCLPSILALFYESVDAFVMMLFIACMPYAVISVSLLLWRAGGWHLAPRRRKS